MFFRYGSPFYRFMNFVTNLILLNLLWIFTSLPIFTAGASTTAMYHVLLQYVNKQDDEVVKPYFRSFKRNFKQATLIWIPHSLLGLALGAELFYLSETGAGVIWWILFVAVAVLYMMVSAMLYPMLGRYENTTRAIIFNSMNLTFRNLLPMVSAAVLNAAPLLLLLLDLEKFLWTSLVWTFGGLTLLCYLNAVIVMRIFRKYEEPEEPEA